MPSPDGIGGQTRDAECISGPRSARGPRTVSHPTGAAPARARAARRGMVTHYIIHTVQRSECQYYNTVASRDSKGYCATLRGSRLSAPPKSTSPPPAAPGPARALGLSVRSARGSAGAGRSRSSQEYQCHRREHSTHGSWSMDREVFMLGRRILPRRTPRHRRPLTTALTHAPRAFVTPSRCLVAQQDAARTEYVTCAVGEELDLVQVRGQVVRRLVLLPRLAAVFGAEDRAAAAHGPRRLAIG